MEYTSSSSYFPDSETGSDPDNMSAPPSPTPHPKRLLLTQMPMLPLTEGASPVASLASILPSAAMSLPGNGMGTSSSKLEQGGTAAYSMKTTFTE